MTSPMAKAVTSRRNNALSLIEAQQKDGVMAKARQLAVMPVQKAIAEARRIEMDNDGARFVVSAAADDSFCDTAGMEERLRTEGWQIAGPAVYCRATGIRVKALIREEAL